MIKNSVQNKRGMKQKIHRASLACVVTFIGLSATTLVSAPCAFASVPSGSYYGYQQLEKRVLNRIIKPSRKDQWNLSFFLTRTTRSSSRVDGLDRLLGYYENGQFQNGAPNALNWTFASLVFTKLSQALSESCTGWSSYRQWFQHKALKATENVCTEASNSGVISEETLLDFWILLMGYDASFDEFEAWMAFSNSEVMRSLPEPERVAKMAKTILMNPYFLIRN